MNKNVVLALTVFSLVAGYYLVSSVSAGDVDIPVILHDSVPHHQAPLDAPMGEHVPMLAPVDGVIPCPTIDAHRTDVPLTVPTGAPVGAPLEDAPLSAPTGAPLFDPAGAPIAGHFPCGVPAS